MPRPAKAACRSRDGSGDVPVGPAVAYDVTAGPCPGLHATVEVDHVDARSTQEPRRLTRACPRAAHGNDLLVRRHLTGPRHELVEWDVVRVRGVTRVPLVVTADVEQHGTIIEQLPGLGDIHRGNASGHAYLLGLASTGHGTANRPVM
jgi:hypothetical protein